MKFQVGEIAIATVPLISEHAQIWTGQEVEVLMAGPWKAGDVGAYRGVEYELTESGDYVVGEFPVWICCVPESYLRKRDEPTFQQFIQQIFEEPVSA